MFERSEPVLKIICLGLAALLVLKFSHLALRNRGFDQVRIPEIPSLPSGTNSLATPKASTPASPSGGAKQTANSAAGKEGDKSSTNKVAGSTNSAGTNATMAANANTNGTNTAAAAKSSGADTNAAATSTNSVAGKPGGANTIAKGDLPKPGPDAVAGARPGGRPPRGPGMPGMMGMGGPGNVNLSDLPEKIRSHVDKITQSEILGPVMRPIPMGLLGIAGPDVFLRAPNGQTGMIREGGELGGVKLLKVGINRVLVEENGKPVELTIYAGMGGESLMPKTKEKE
ncbi:MAG TPA: hypothetical protein VHH73_20885 [Verrucomicrobiae bacterium]|nr:hypothetical protein [Verrucomicrobiae bacterium]